MDELNKLEEYLKANHYEYQRLDNTEPFDSHQIIVYRNHVRSWDAIWSYGSFGYNSGKLEIMGAIVFPDDNDSVVGYLTANDVIHRLNKLE